MCDHHSLIMKAKCQKNELAYFIIRTCSVFLFSPSACFHMLSITEAVYYTSNRIRRNNLAPQTNMIVNTMGNILLSLRAMQFNLRLFCYTQLDHMLI